MVEETSAMQAQAGVLQRDPMICPVQQKRLAEMGPDGMYLWCKACRREHLFTWYEIDLARIKLASSLLSKPITTCPECCSILSSETVKEFEID